MAWDGGWIYELQRRRVSPRVDSDAVSPLSRRQGKLFLLSKVLWVQCGVVVAGRLKVLNRFLCCAVAVRFCPCVICGVSGRCEGNIGGGVPIVSWKNV